MSELFKHPSEHWEVWLDHLESGAAPWGTEWNANLREVIEGYQEVIHRLKKNGEQKNSEGEALA